MAAVVQNSLSESLCSTFCDGGKENKAGWASWKWNSGCWHDTDLESGAEASDLEDEFSESKEELWASAQEDKP